MIRRGCSNDQSSNTNGLNMNVGIHERSHATPGTTTGRESIRSDVHRAGIEHRGRPVTIVASSLRRGKERKISVCPLETRSFDRCVADPVIINRR